MLIKSERSERILTSRKGGNHVPLPTPRLYGLLPGFLKIVPNLCDSGYFKITLNSGSMNYLSSHFTGPMASNGLEILQEVELREEPSFVASTVYLPQHILT